PLFGQKELEQAHLQLEVVVVGGDQLDATSSSVQKLPVLVWRRSEGLLDQDDVAEVVVASQRRKVRRRGRRDVRDDVAARLELALELITGGGLGAVPVEGGSSSAGLPLPLRKPRAGAVSALRAALGAETVE